MLKKPALSTKKGERLWSSVEMLYYVQFIIMGSIADFQVFQNAGYIHCGTQ